MPVPPMPGRLTERICCECKGKIDLTDDNYELMYHKGPWLWSRLETIYRCGECARDIKINKLIE